MEASSFKQISLASLLIFLALFSFYSSPASAARHGAMHGADPSIWEENKIGTVDTRFVRTSCGATAYPKLCYTTLSIHASAIRSDPKLLAQAALSVSLETARSTSAMMVELAQAHGLTPREVGAMRDCVEELGDSVDQIKKSLGEMKQLPGSDFALTINDIQTWVSAALTEDDTCTEGFAGKSMSGKGKTAVRERIVNVAHITSNALALINSYASLHN